MISLHGGITGDVGCMRSGHSGREMLPDRVRLCEVGDIPRATHHNEETDDIPRRKKGPGMSWRVHVCTRICTSGDLSLSSCASELLLNPYSLFCVHLFQTTQVMDDTRGYRCQEGTKRKIEGDIE